MLPRLFYRENEESKSVWWFHDGSMRLYNAPVLDILCIQLGPQCPVDVDVAKWVTKALDHHRLCRLYFKLQWNSEPIRMPSSLYTCKTLTALILSHKILVDVPSSVSLPLLATLSLLSVVYKDEDSLVRLLSSCPVLKWLHVERSGDVEDNVRKFTVKVPSLLSLRYENNVIQNEDEDEEEEDDDDGTDKSLVIDTPALEYLEIDDISLHSCSTEYMPHLIEATFDVAFYPNGNFLRSLSSINYMTLTLFHPLVTGWTAINYSQLRVCSLQLFDPMCESLAVLLSNCPILEATE